MAGLCQQKRGLKTIKQLPVQPIVVGPSKEYSEKRANSYSFAGLKLKVGAIPTFISALILLSEFNFQ